MTTNTNTFNPGPEWEETDDVGAAQLVLYGDNGTGFIQGWVHRTLLPAWTVAEKPNGVRYIKNDTGNWYPVVYTFPATIDESDLVVLASRPVETDK